MMMMMMLMLMMIVIISIIKTLARQGHPPSNYKSFPYIKNHIWKIIIIN